MNNYFSTLGPKHASEIPETDLMPEVYIKEISATFKLNMVTENEVRKTLRYGI